jgi:hypothetical protein
MKRPDYLAYYVAQKGISAFLFFLLCVVIVLSLACVLSGCGLFVVRLHDTLVYREPGTTAAQGGGHIGGLIGGLVPFEAGARAGVRIGGPPRVGTVVEYGPYGTRTYRVGNRGRRRR